MKLRTHLSWYSQWCLPWRQNWFDFDLIHLGFEVSWHTGTILELTARLLGLGFDWEVWDDEKREAFCRPFEQMREDYFGKSGGIIFDDEEKELTVRSREGG